MRIIYSILIYLAAPFFLLRLLWRSRKNIGYKKRWGERFGFFRMQPNYTHGIWIHVVSVGEVLAAIPLVKAIQKEFPDLPLTVTTMTPTGSDRVLANFPTSVFHVYAPYDLPGAVNRFLNKVKPRLAIFMETELWPNILHSCKKRNIPSLLANARLSARSAFGYQHFQPLVKNMLNCLTVIAAQAKPDAERFIQLGTQESQVTVTGNMKFDLQISGSLLESAEVLKQQIGHQRPVWIAASTHEGEDEQILEAFQMIRKDLPQSLLILVPRHPERFERVAQLCKKYSFHITRRSTGETCQADTDVFLGDTMGELRLMFATAEIAFIGGSLIPRGGHNMLEAAAFGIPVITGPHTFNFAETVRLLNEANALITITNARELAAQIVRLFNDPALKQELGNRGKEVVNANRGALEQHINLIKKIINS